MPLTGLLTYSYDDGDDDDNDDDWWCLQIYYDDGEWLQLTLQVTTVH